ncbi:Uncharacterised protein [Yersinia enterocolitica]|uniref:Uncharacterized protein n=1 Tax=Yersinia enterocolitica TaxID=630 RepID=A0ABM9S8Z0_YEREN|nr:Uncharacterised protein [Yersinia enterocolitica]CNF39245.1 Uncharacterised protein [Yersinia enterocolitica]CNG29674.1 Uncharacterised protein [Yersinia enterocolitica]CQD73621.1 Uncharacterised protein [Yersinia enterocolitica]
MVFDCMPDTNPFLGKNGALGAKLILVEVIVVCP